MVASVEVAVAPSVKSPGLYMTVNLTAGQSSPGSAPLKGLIISPKGSAGTITNDTQLIEGVAGDDAVKGYLGAGTPGHLAAKALFQEYGLALVDLVAPAPSGGSVATGTITYAAGAPTVAWDITATICGREVTTTWAAGETDEQGATKLKNAINALSDDLPVIATNLLGALTITAKIAGTWGNDITYSVVAANGTTGTVTAAGAACTGGTQEMNIATALETASGKGYDLILLCTSNADAIAASATSGPGRLKTHIRNNNSGYRAKLQQAVVGLSSAIAEAKAGAAQHNFGPMQYILCLAGQSLPCEWGAAELGARMREESIDPAVNRIELPYRATLYGAADLIADTMTGVEVEDCLNSGVTPVVYDGTKAPMPSRPITTYFQDSGSNPDYRVLDTSRVSGTYAVAKDLRVALPQEFKGVKLMPDQEPGEEPPPPKVVEVRDVKSFIHGRMLFWCQAGVVNKIDYLKAYENGQFIVRVNPSDSTQCDIVLPFQIVPPLAKFSLVVNHTGS